jgi:putative membrane-bound dehydrogenase-like protein
MWQSVRPRCSGRLFVSLFLVAGCLHETHAGELKVDGRTIRVPDGFTVERIAGPPLVDRPITAAFDDEGRLYVADSSGSNDNVQTQVKERPHRIVRLVDSDGDGVYDKQTVFADKMMFPEGTMWLSGSLYVAAPPSIWKLTDTNGDGVADSRIEWFQGKTLTGCANDLHGPYPGLDGWIYWCKGAFAQQTYARPGESPFSTRAAHVFRARPDGTGIEPVMTGGMDNPVDVVFTPGGERIFTTTFFVHPGGGQRDGLIHAIYGGIYGKVHDPIFEPAHKWTGPEVMPVMLHMGPAAPCGLTRYESEALGKDYKDNLFACYFNLHKVSRHVLAQQGATFKTEDQDFVTSPDLDFHPTDVIEDAAGSLVVVDTGGWYKLCCPTSQLQKPDVLGAVYRVRRNGIRPLDDPWGKGLRDRAKDLNSTTNVKEFVALLGDPRPAVRRKAIEILAAPERKELVLAALGEVVLKDHSPELRRNIVWTLGRIDQPAAREQVRRYLRDADEIVIQTAIHTAGLWRDHLAVPRLIELLEAPPMHNRRAAAEALGRIRDKSAVPALLAASGQPSDRVLEHSLMYALIQIGDREGTQAGLNAKRNGTQRAALVALDQMNNGGLDSQFVAGLLDSPHPMIKETATWIAGRHPEWAGALAGVFDQRLVHAVSAAERAELERQLGRFSQSAAVQDLLAARLRDPSAPLPARRSSLQAMSWSGLNEKQIPGAWLSALTSVLDGSPSNADLVPRAVDAIRSLPLTRDGSDQLSDRLLQVAASTQYDALRLSALAAIPGGLKQTNEKTLTFLLGKLNREQTVVARTTAADVLARAKLTTEQLMRLAGELRSAGPVETDRLLAAFEQSTDESLGLALVKALGDSAGFASLRPDALKACLAKFGPAVQKAAQGLFLRLNVDAAKQKARLEELVPTLATGDIRRGQVVFHSEKAACFSCHAIGYRGGTVGPDLTKIGSVRSGNELLEAIVFPSSSLVRSFEPIAVATSDGKVFNGLLRGENADEIRLATGVNQEARIARREIEEIRPSTVSIMPAGLDQQLTHQELADLVAFLKACK